MCFCPGKRLKCMGLTLSIIFFFAALICIILAGVNYNFTNFNFVSAQYSWKNLGALQLASIIYTLFTSLLGIFTFWCANICLIIIFSIVLLFSMIFTFAIAIFGLVAGSVSTFDSYVGCNSQYTGVMQVWANVDNYLVEVDSQLCSVSCPCSFNNTLAYTGNLTVAPYYATWFKSVGGAISYQNCSNAVKLSVDNYYNTTTSYSTPIDQTSFATLYNLIETSFSCTGFCKTTYTPRGSVVATQMWKYMFSDLSNGPPTYQGCLKSITDWLPPLLKAFGSIALIVAILEFLVFIMAISLCCVKKKEDKNSHQIESKDNNSNKDKN